MVCLYQVCVNWVANKKILLTQLQIFENILILQLRNITIQNGHSTVVMNDLVLQLPSKIYVFTVVVKDGLITGNLNGFQEAG
jgi:hypothetical protein